jgi:hypothetical protein
MERNGFPRKVEAPSKKKEPERVSVRALDTLQG